MRTRSPLNAIGNSANCAQVALWVVLFGYGMYWATSLVTGCASPDVHVPDQTAPIKQVQVTTATVATDIPARAGRIDQDADGYAAKTSPQQRAVFGPFLTSIKTETSGLRDDGVKLATLKPQLESVEKNVAQVQKQNADDEKAVADLQAQLKNEKTSRINHILDLALALGVLALGGAVFMLVEGNVKLGLPVAAAGAAVIATSITLIQYELWIAIGGLLLLAGLGAYLIYRVVKEKTAKAAAVAVASDAQTALTDAKAVHATVTKDLTQTVEAAKQLMPADAKALLFGTGAIPGKADVIQSNTTQATVATVRPTVRLAIGTQTAPAVTLVPIAK